jgi:hypothetical protein
MICNKIATAQGPAIEHCVSRFSGAGTLAHHIQCVLATRTEGSRTVRIARLQFLLQPSQHLPVRSLVTVG